MPTPYVPSPRTWSAGDLVTTPRLRADVSGAVQLLAQPPMLLAQQGNAQTIPNSNETGMALDTEVYDNYNGHSLASGSSTSSYFGMLPGWYLAQAAAPLDYTAGAGTMGVSVAANIGGAGGVVFGGERVPNSSATPQRAFPVAAKLVEMTNTGTYGGATNDFLFASVFQDSGASQPLYPGTNRFPYVTVQWVGASSGTTGLPVPPLAVSPSPITSAYLNANVRDTINFLLYPPLLEYQYNAGTQSLASQSTLPAVGTTLPLGSKIVDNYSAYNSSTFTWTAPVAGVYWCYNVAAMAGAATILALASGLTVTSSNYNSGSPVTLWGGTRTAFAGTRIQAVACRRRIRLNAGDTVSPAGWQHDSAAAAATVAGNSNEWQSRLIIVWRNA